MRIIDVDHPDANGLLWDPSGRYLLITSQRSVMTLVDLAQETPRPINLPVDSTRFHMATFSPTGRYIMCAAGHGGLFVYDLQPPEPTIIFQDATYGLSCASRQDGLVIGVVSDNTGSRLRIWNWSNFEEPIVDLEHDVGRWYANPIFLEDDEHYCCVERRDVDNETSSTRDWLAMRRVDTNELITDERIGNYVTGPLVWSEPSKCLYTAQQSNLRRWKPFEPTVPSRNRRLQNSKSQINWLAVHPTRPRLLLTSGSPNIKVIDTETNMTVARLSWKIGKVKAVAFHPDGLTAAAISRTGKFILWDFDS